jgi:hypothetical protein
VAVRALQVGNELGAVLAARQANTATHFPCAEILYRIIDMSQVIPQSQIESGGAFGMLIDDTSVFNIRILQAGLGCSSVQTTKEWCYKHGIRPDISGREWIFTGKNFRLQVQAKGSEQPEAETDEVGRESFSY